MVRSRHPIRIPGEDPSESSNSTSPERAVDDDTDFFTHQANDSQSSLGVGTLRDVPDSTSTIGNIVIPPIGYLPPELIISIFAKLSSTVDMLNCMRVCRSWAMNCVALLWHRPACNTWDNLQRVASVVANTGGYFPYYEFVKRLNLSAMAKLLNDGTIFSFVQCKRIERLTLIGCSKLTDNGISELVTGNRQLQALDVSGVVSLTDHTLFTIAKNCSRLQGLNISECSQVTDDSLVAVAESCRHLKRLKLNGVSQATDRSIQAFATNCPSILEIDLHSCKLITSTSLTALLSTLRHLRELRLAHCEEISDSAFLNLPENLTFDTLRVLDLTACARIGDDSVQKIIDTTPRLRNLVLSKCVQITDRSLLSICRLGKNIHYVHFGHCSNITDWAVTQLVKSCNRIRYIDLACCNRLTDASVLQLATLPKLRRIGLVKCQAITDRSIQALAKPKATMHPLNVSSLERVHLSYCIHLTMEGIHALLNNCPRLTHLSLTGVQAFLRSDLTAFCRNPPDEFTAQQRELFCVFSGEGVVRLRNYLNRTTDSHHQEGTMYVDGDDLDEDEGQVTGLMNATVIHDDNDGTGDGDTDPQVAG